MAVRTVFVAGLPADCTGRELHLLFYEGGGCEAIHIERTAQHGTTAFVQFATRDRALQVVEWAQGMIFDPSMPTSTIRAEMARTDFRRPVPKNTFPQSAAVGAAPAKRMRGPGSRASADRDASTLFLGSLGEGTTRQDVEEYAASQEGLLNVTMKDEGSSRAVAWAEYSSPELATMALLNLSSAPIGSAGKVPNVEIARHDASRSGSQLASPLDAFRMHSRVGPGSGPAAGTSSTVFLGNLEAQVTEEEVQSMVAAQEGFLRVTCRGIGFPRATAWAQFENSELALAACAALAQEFVPSMGRPANVELARSDMRRQ